MVAFTCCVGVMLWAVFVTARSLPSPLEIVTHQNIKRETNHNGLTRIKRKNSRNDIILRPLSGPGLPYFYDIAFTSPCGQPDQIRISVDTGSSDFWIDSRYWCDCQDAVRFRNFREICSRVQAARSSGGEWLRYDDNAEVYGAFMTEDLIFGQNGEILPQTTFMAAWDYKPKNSPDFDGAMNGLVGLGYVRNQQTHHEKYYTLPHVLEQNGNTTSNAFTMWFDNDVPDEDFVGYIFFGGYVTNYFKGTLKTFSILRYEGSTEPTDIMIQLDRIVFKGEDQFVSCEDSLPVLLDTGTYSSWLPYDTFRRVVNEIGSNKIVDDGHRIYAVFPDCNDLNFDESVQFQFGDMKIPVPLWDIVRPVTEDEVAARGPTEIVKIQQCLTHGIAAYPGTYSRAVLNGPSDPVPPSSHNERHILGATFLRHTIITYDLSQGEVALAPSNQSAIHNEEPDTFSFDDTYPHQKQGSYRPTVGMEEICSLK